MNQNLDLGLSQNWIVLICALILGFVSVSAALGQDDIEIAKEILSKRNYPWYDSSQDGIRKIEFPDRADAKSRDRGDVPLRVVNQKKSATTTGVAPNGLGISIFAWVAVAFLIAGLSGLLIWAFFRLESRKRETNSKFPQHSIAESVQNLPFGLEEEVGDFRQLAENAYRNGDARGAITYLFSHVLVTLDQKGLIRLRKGKTNRHYLKELRPHRTLADFFQQVMIPFESVFFGDHELSELEFESCWNQLDEFQDRANRKAQVHTSQVLS